MSSTSLARAFGAFAGTAFAVEPGMDRPGSAAPRAVAAVASSVGLAGVKDRESHPARAMSRAMPGPDAHHEPRRDTNPPAIIRPRRSVKSSFKVAPIRRVPSRLQFRLVSDPGMTPTSRNILAAG